MCDLTLVAKYNHDIGNTSDIITNHYIVKLWPFEI